MQGAERIPAVCSSLEFSEQLLSTTRNVLRSTGDFGETGGALKTSYGSAAVVGVNFIL